MRLAIERNLSALSSGCQELLRLASLFGREFPVGALVSASRIDPRRVLALLDEAEAARIVEVEPGEPGRGKPRTA